MHDHRNAGTGPAPPRANTPPPAGNVYGLGLVDALRVDMQPAQLPWLAAEIGIVRYCRKDELAHLRARSDELPEAAKKNRFAVEIGGRRPARGPNRGAGGASGNSYGCGRGGRIFDLASLLIGGPWGLDLRGDAFRAARAELERRLGVPIPGQR